MKKKPMIHRLISISIELAFEHRATDNANACSQPERNVKDLKMTIIYEKHRWLAQPFGCTDIVHQRSRETPAIEGSIPVWGMAHDDTDGGGTRNVRPTCPKPHYNRGTLMNHIPFGLSFVIILALALVSLSTGAPLLVKHVVKKVLVRGGIQLLHKHHSKGAAKTIQEVHYVALPPPVHTVAHVQPLVLPSAGHHLGFKHY
uniref:Uncharacterized protein n=1 Tax=Anopheles farauti TaxID=69004 RepID=A0A182QDT4_9DIPT